MQTSASPLVRAIPRSSQGSTGGRGFSWPLVGLAVNVALWAALLIGVAKWLS